jgi:glycosyltransferase involved in cell wall biosynthesis
MWQTCEISDMPLVSIVTPSYNHGRFIRETIKSVLAQDYQRIEYLVMDGGSTDETSSIVSEYRDRLQFFNEPDRGQADAINKGFRRARGDILAWLNSDDVILPGAVSRAVLEFQKEKSIGAVYGDGYIINDAGEIVCRFPSTEPFDLWRLIHVSDYILQQTAYFRRDAIVQVGYVDESLHWGLDWDLLIRIGKRYGITFIPECMGCIREHPSAKTATGGFWRWRELVAIMRRHGEMRYPPAYFTYGAETFTRRLPDSIRQSAIKFVWNRCDRFARRKRRSSVGLEPLD